MVTGSVSASTAIGRLDASMLDIATTSSMTNSMKVPDCSSTPSGWIRMKVQATPKNRSSRMKRSRQERRFAVRRRLVEELPAQPRDVTRWMMSAPPVQAPEASAPVHKLDSSADGDARAEAITSDPDSRFCANWRNNS